MEFNPDLEKFEDIFTIFWQPNMTEHKTILKKFDNQVFNSTQKQYKMLSKEIKSGGKEYLILLVEND